MSYFAASIKQMLGANPGKPAPEDYSPEAREIHVVKKGRKETKAELMAIEEAHALHERRHLWRKRRWMTLILVNLLFVVSYYFDVQLLEGALTASRFIGFHMADLNSALQVMLAFKHVVLNLLIGTVTVFILWILVGGRTFCSWVCPYHLLAEWTETLHLWLEAKKWIRPVTFHRGARTIFYVLFALLALVTGYTVFETLSPTGILSRAMIYGPGLALLWVLLLLLFEVFVSRRAWCRYVCPIGLTYGLVGSISPVRVKYNLKDCHHEGNCRKVCLVPHVLDMTIKGRAADVDVPVGADCTRCGLCVDACPTSSLTYEVLGLKKLQ
ncbi:MAG: NapH/MauN family ferredoxin-type protein [Gammaproteobacteria bacterium]|nr:NapH/MauN family ferredoxin-type protein [Gammaproteobacteria bacterium]MBU1654473.1 NapH/MauN family ferredoxin-type protein [Gammaproteobacteria bacterium]MBU1962631.1 NapH/MauN family ferredoxin-type protein [Gammaproteobacteria bacterium]